MNWPTSSSDGEPLPAPCYGASGNLESLLLNPRQSLDARGSSPNSPGCWERLQSLGAAGLAWGVSSHIIPGCARGSGGCRREQALLRLILVPKGEG